MSHLVANNRTFWEVGFSGSHFEFFAILERLAHVTQNSKSRKTRLSCRRSSKPTRLLRKSYSMYILKILTVHVYVQALFAVL